MTYKFIKYIFFCIIPLIIPTTTFAENIVEYSQPEFREFIVEYSYPYMVSTYSDRQQIQLIKDRSRSKYNTPEDTLISFQSAMANKDYEWFLDSWSMQDRLKFAREDKENGRNEDFFYKLWDKEFLNKHLILLKRIQRNQYIYIGYVMRSDDNDSDENPQSLAFVFENNKWLVTNEAMCDPILTGWNDLDQKIRRPGEIGKIENQCNP